MIRTLGMIRTFGSILTCAAAVMETEEGGKMVSRLGTVKPREIRYEPPIEVIFDKYNHEAAPPQFRPRAAEHTASR
ncbi:MAG TPA: hypothetical protein VNF49_03545 [Candidatus Binataceae bacterium]|nr:hypothetical protein [Candidatus Binataceae bacterium]